MGMSNPHLCELLVWQFHDVIEFDNIAVVKETQRFDLRRGQYDGRVCMAGSRESGDGEEGLGNVGIAQDERGLYESALARPTTRHTSLNTFTAVVGNPSRVTFLMATVEPVGKCFAATTTPK